MSNYDIYLNIFKKVFLVNDVTEVEKIAFGKTAGWDSVGHMRLVVEVEEAFGIMLEPLDVMKFESFASGKEIIKKYGIDI